MSDANRYPLLRRTFPTILALAILISMALRDWFDWRWRTSSDPVKWMNLIADWDAHFIKAADDKGLFIRFQNFKAPPNQAMTLVYFRAAYLLYPLPVITAHEGAVINTPEQLYATNFQPDDRWLAQRNIAGVLVVDEEGNAGHRFAYPILIRRVEPARPTTAGQ
jgi:hypothetical protein